VADLRFNREDGDYWYYKPSNGDKFTSEWAFARRPDGCGMYWVWRDERGWRRYEPTRAWGLGLGGQFRTTQADVGDEDISTSRILQQLGLIRNSIEDVSEDEAKKGVKQRLDEIKKTLGDIQKKKGQ